MIKCVNPLLLGVISGIMVTSLVGCNALGTRQQVFTPSNLSMQDVKSVRSHAWANLPWTGNNTPYQQVRQEMESADAAGQDMEALRIEYGLLSQQHPKDPLAQFRWAYASALSITPTTGGGTAHSKMFGVAEALARVPSPQTYDYMREQFLIEVWFSRTKGLEQLGQRLIERAPNDYPVQCAYLWVLHWSPLSGAHEKALFLANQLIKQYPTKSKPRNLLANIYTERWWSTHNKDDANKALSSFQEYLRLTPSTDTHREEVVQLMKSIKKEIDAQG